MITPLNSAIFEPSESNIWNLVIWVIVIIAVIAYCKHEQNSGKYDNNNDDHNDFHINDDYGY